jgi:exosortase A-associated hydrolase 1
MSLAAPERALWLACEGEQLPAILHPTCNSAKVGVLMIVGGRQYRVGSGRFFVLAARALAQRGIPVLRFDARGMGDSDGAVRSFTDRLPDIQAAVGRLREELPELEGVVLWGLCDAASAALLDWGATRDPYVLGLALLNPWVRSEQTLARTRLRHHYRIRLKDPHFWSRLFRGEVHWRSLLGWLSDWRTGQRLQRATQGFQARMAQAWLQFPGPMTVVLSRRDVTALEFHEAASTLEEWRGALERPGLSYLWIDDADHTFSGPAHRTAVVEATIQVVDRIARSRQAQASVPEGAA